jgi:NifB/MoaA-like Fe-S oxidoreductase
VLRVRTPALRSNQNITLPFAALDGRTRLTFVSAMTVTLTAEQEEFIRSNVTELREKIATGMEQIRRGEMVDGRTAIQNLREKLRQRPCASH